MRRAWVRQVARDRRPVSDYVKTTFRGRYAESNRALAEMLGPKVDLGDYEGAEHASSSQVERMAAQ
jgi:hypothetical protein